MTVSFVEEDIDFELDFAMDDSDLGKTAQSGVEIGNGALILSNKKAVGMLVDENMHRYAPKTTTDKKRCKDIKNLILDSPLIAYGAKEILKRNGVEGYAPHCCVKDESYGNNYADFEFKTNDVCFLKVRAKPFHHLEITHSAAISDREVVKILSHLLAALKASASEYDIALFKLGQTK